MDRTTKNFIIFLSVAFVIVTAIIMFGGYSYQLKDLKLNKPQQENVTAPADLSSYSDAMHEKIASKWSPPSVDKDAKVVLEFTLFTKSMISYLYS